MVSKKRLQKSGHFLSQLKSFKSKSEYEKLIKTSKRDDLDLLQTIIRNVIYCKVPLKDLATDKRKLLPYQELLCEEKLFAKRK